jgi:lipid II:glycine glycyltransferase (peptidoglycan interpeptide bridge formation enzyme)
MAVTLTIADESFQKTWDAIVLSSSHSTIFHTWQWLKLAEIQTAMELLPILIYKGTQLIALYPLFLQEKGSLHLAFSPPPRAYMLYLGPVIVDYNSFKQDKKESIYIQIQDEVDKYLFDIKKCKFARIRSSPGLYDSRPLTWSGYTVNPYYTYRIDLTKGIHPLWEQFDGDLRRSITKSVKEGITVRIGDKEDLQFIHQSLFNRYIAQGLKPHDNTKYLNSLYDSFYPDNLKIFVAEYKDEKIGGTFNLCFKDTMYFWVGLPKTDLGGIYPNDLINWEAIKWAQLNGLKYYELMDSGDDPRLRHFKSKYNPRLIIWYEAKKYSSYFYNLGEKLLRMTQKII